MKGENVIKKITIQCALCGMLAALVVGGMPMQETDACTRAVYLGPEDTIITVRSMDWKGDTATNLWAFPRGLNRDGAAGREETAGARRERGDADADHRSGHGIALSR
jgi:hypothetical protein